MACDYRKPECSSTGVNIDGKWQCNKHLTSIQCVHGNALDEKMKAASQEALNIRALALLDATKAICGYCAKGESCGHEEIPYKIHNEWQHDFIVGNGSNPCSAGPIWNLVEDCLKCPSRYTNWLRQG